MSKKGSAYHCPPKRFSVPADLPPLQNFAKVLVNAMRATFSKRIREANKK
jgi:hypothetical protein